MCYEKYFYKKENIIGFTGDINNKPTVYFKDGDKFGRITQFYKKAENIGRNKVREFGDYHIENINGRAYEYYNGNPDKFKHFSRNEFIQSDEISLEELSKSIESFKNGKPKLFI